MERVRVPRGEAQERGAHGAVTRGGRRRGGSAERAEDVHARREADERRGAGVGGLSLSKPPPPRRSRRAPEGPAAAAARGAEGEDAQRAGDGGGASAARRTRRGRRRRREPPDERRRTKRRTSESRMRARDRSVRRLLPEDDPEASEDSSPKTPGTSPRFRFRGFPPPLREASGRACGSSVQRGDEPVIAVADVAVSGLDQLHVRAHARRKRRPRTTARRRSRTTRTRRRRRPPPPPPPPAPAPAPIDYTRARAPRPLPPESAASPRACACACAWCCLSPLRLRGCWIRWIRPASPKRSSAAARFRSGACAASRASRA